MVYRSPIISAVGRQHAVVMVGAGEACVVPRRLHKGVEGIGLTLSCSAASGAAGVDKRGHFLSAASRYRQIRHLWAVPQAADPLALATGPHASQLILGMGVPQ